MASVKKTMKSSETKKAKKPGIRTPKAKASKRFAVSKAQKTVTRPALAAKKAAAESCRKEGFGEACRQDAFCQDKRRQGARCQATRRQKGRAKGETENQNGSRRAFPCRCSQEYERKYDQEKDCSRNARFGIQEPNGARNKTGRCPARKTGAHPRNCRQTHHGNETSRGCKARRRPENVRPQGFARQNRRSRGGPPQAGGAPRRAPYKNRPLARRPRRRCWRSSKMLRASLKHANARPWPHRFGRP